MRATIEAIERQLMQDGFVKRYDTGSVSDGLPRGEGVFLPCSFWLADNLVLLNRHEEAQRLFERLLALRNDVGLLSEEYDPRAHAHQASPLVEELCGRRQSASRPGTQGRPPISSMCSSRSAGSSYTRMA